MSIHLSVLHLYFTENTEYIFEAVYLFFLLFIFIFLFTLVVLIPIVYCFMILNESVLTKQIKLTLVESHIGGYLDSSWFLEDRSVWCTLQGNHIPHTFWHQNQDNKFGFLHIQGTDMDFVGHNCTLGHHIDLYNWKKTQ